MSARNQTNPNGRTGDHAGYIKKSYDFYKTSGNLWQSRYLASPKMLRYFHIPNELYLSGPNSPMNLSIKQAESASSAYSAKASINITESKIRLNKRKLERNHKQSLSRQIPATAMTELTPIKLVPKNDSPLHLNAWESLNNIPASKLRHVLPPKVIEKDLQAIENILLKSDAQSKDQEFISNQKQLKKMQEQLDILGRHNYSKSLEQKSGVTKVHEYANCGNFGYVKAYKTSERIHELSLPRRLKKTSVMEHYDFRGLLHSDFPEAVNKVDKKGLSEKRVKKSYRSFGNSDLENVLKDINEFEKNLVKK